MKSYLIIVNFQQENVMEQHVTIISAQIMEWIMHLKANVSVRIYSNKTFQKKN